MENPVIPETTKPEETLNSELAPAEAEVVSSPYETDPIVNTPTPKKPRSKKPLIIILAVVLIAALGAGAYWQFFRTKPTAKTNSTAPAEESKAKTSFKTTTKNYNSTNFRLSVDYPDDWTVDDTATDQLYIKSPTVSLTDGTGASTTGIVQFRVRSKSLPMPEFDSGNAMAARESEKIDYAKPSAVQRGSTHLSFLRYASSTGGGLAMDGIYITGDTGYTKDQAIPKADFVPIDPQISIVFVENCSGSDCPDPKPLSIAAANWDNGDFSDPLKTMLKSIIVN